MLELLLAVLSSATLASGSIPDSGTSTTYALVGGLWFDGDGFESRDYRVVEGRLSDDPPGESDEVIDLTGRFVIPPFGEAHTHRPYSARSAAADSAAFLRDGVFYAKNQGIPPSSVAEGIELLAGPTTLDVAFAFAGITGRGGHVVDVYEGLKKRGIFAGQDLDGEAYLLIDSEEELDSKWPLLMAMRPDFVKTYLQYSDEYAERHGEEEFFGHTALNPILIPKIVEKAHAASLRVSCHIETAADFHHAVIGGVDEISHLPGYWVGPGEDMAPYRIEAEDADLAASHGVVCVTTISLSASRFADDPDHLARVLKLHAENLSVLQLAGVAIAVGSDLGNDTSLGEMRLLQQLDLFDPVDLLKMWCEVSPRTIFPDRAIGYLVPGSEASFLVIAGDPLSDLDFVEDIVLRMKQGVLLED